MGVRGFPRVEDNPGDCGRKGDVEPAMVRGRELGVKVLSLLPNRGDACAPLIRLA